MDPIKKATVMLSGGIDSCVALYWAIEEYCEVDVLIFKRSGQPTAELNAAFAICDAADRIPSVIDTKQMVGSGGIESNLLYYSIAAQWSYIRQNANLVGGHIKDDWNIACSYNASQSFFRNLQRMLDSEYHDLRIMIVQPLITMSKKEVVKLGHDLGAPMQLSWSCIRDVKTPCNTCSQCLARIEVLDG